MGGQACVLYGAAEFSRDCDIVILAEAGNFDRLRGALAELEATCIAIPAFDPQFLDRGHAVHFRCHQADALVKRRPLLNEAFGASRGAIEAELHVEERAEKEADRVYWQPLKRELEQLRRNLTRQRGVGNA